jgi:hypothetical protein
MGDRVQEQFLKLVDDFIGYLPSLIAGVILILLGWFLGWFIKRVLVQLSILLRLERFLVRSRWAEDFSKADVRYGLYNFIGNLGFIIVFLIFVNNALSAWKLTILSDLLGKGILFLPRLIIALMVFGIGWLIATAASKGVYKALRREEIPRAMLISRMIKAVLLLFFSAMALVEVDIAEEIVVIGFATIIITMSLLTVVITAIGGKEFITKIGESMED